MLRHQALDSKCCLEIGIRDPSGALLGPLVSRGDGGGVRC